MMSQHQRDLIRASFQRVQPDKQRAGEVFYQELFALTPELKTMFERASIMTQGGKLMQVIEHAVAGLDQWDALTADLEQLGARHAGYGVRPDHYAAVGAALITTLRKTLGAGLSEEAAEAWIEFYTDLSLAMEKGACDAAG